jgi:hypothetical protein
MDTKAPFDPLKDMVPIAGTAEYCDHHGRSTKACR